MILEVISECIGSLFKIGILIRKARPGDRFKRALQVSDLTVPDNFYVDYVHQKHPKVAEDWLSKRLGGAIAKRRQFIIYCRDHRSRLGAEDGADEVVTTHTERLSSKATTFISPNTLETTEAEEGDDDAVSFMSASTTIESLSALKLPRLADLSKDQQPFECPICFTLQSFQREKAWK
jgi:hypothetical protein